MQTLHRLRRFRDLRAILLGVPPSRWPTPSMRRASIWNGAPPLPNLPKPSLTRLGSRPAAAVALIGTGPGSGAVPRGRPCQRGALASGWFRLSQERDRLPDPVCRALLVRQTRALLHSCPAARHVAERGRGGGAPPRSEALADARVPVPAVLGHPSQRFGAQWGEPGRMDPRRHVRRSACLCPSPDR